MSAAVRLAAWTCANASVTADGTVAKACVFWLSAEDADVFFVFFVVDEDEASTRAELESVDRADGSRALVAVNRTVFVPVATDCAVALGSSAALVVPPFRCALMPIDASSSVHAADGVWAASEAVDSEFCMETDAAPAACAESPTGSVPVPCAKTTSAPASCLEPGLDVRHIPALPAGPIPCPQAAVDTVGAIAAAIVMREIYAARLPKPRIATLERCQNDAFHHGKPQIL